MDGPKSHLPERDLKGQREDVRRGLLRVNSAGAVILLVVIALAIAAVVTAFRANKNFAEAQAATTTAQEQLWNSSLSQANAGRLSGLPGIKKRGLEAISVAAQIRPAVELRNEAIAHFALTDLEEAVPLHRVPPFTNPAIDPAGERLGAIGPPDVLHIYDVKTGSELSRTHWPNLRLKCSVFSPNNQILLLTPTDGKLMAVESPSGKLLWQLPSWRIASFTPDSRYVAVTRPGEAQARFFDAVTGEEQPEIIKLDVKATDYEFDPSGQKLVVSLGTSLQIIERETGKVLQELEHNFRIQSMDWRGDVIAVGDSENMVRVWNLKNEESSWLRGHKSLVSRVTLNSRGDMLMSFSYDGTTRLWNPLTGWQILTTTDGIGMGFSDNDTQIVYCTQDGFGAWGVQRPIGFQELSLGNTAYKSVYHVDFSPDSKFLSVSHHEGIRIVHLPTGRIVWFQPMARGRSAYFLPDGKRLLTCGDLRVSIWPVELNAETGEARMGKPKHIKLPNQQHVDVLTLNYERTKASLPISDTDCVIFDVDDPENTMVKIGPTANPKSPSISPDGTKVATGTFHGSGTRLWDARSGKRLRNVELGNASPFFSPDGRLLLVGTDREFRFYDTEKWSVVHKVPTYVPSDLPNAGAFSREGKMVAISKYRSQVELLDTQNFKPIASFTAPESQSIQWMSFNEKATMLALACVNNTVQIWDLAVIRENLGQLGLDWGQKTSPFVVQNPGNKRVNPTQHLFTFLVSAGVVLVIICALYLLRRQRQLIASYMSIDGLIERSNRQLDIARAEIMHSQKMKALGTLAAGIAHDFNNLLSVIRMASKLIGRETKHQPEVIDNIAEIEQAVFQGKNIVRSMLGYSRDVEEDRTAVALPDLVEDTVGLLSKEFLSGITLNLKLEPNIPLINVSRSHIEQILLNLVVNASEAMKGKGTLRIIVRCSPRGEISYVLSPKEAESYLELIVGDTGPGISREIISRIFEPFFTTKTVGAQRGTGLGLSMVYTIAEQNGFGIEVRSPTDGGVEFRLHIPLEVQNDIARPLAGIDEDHSIESGTVRQSHIAATTGDR